MPIINQTEWAEWVRTNPVGYGKNIIKVAGEIMRLLDLPEYANFDAYKMLWDNSHLGGNLTMIQTNYVVSIIEDCHSRGKEFIESWKNGGKVK